MIDFWAVVVSLLLIGLAYQLLISVSIPHVYPPRWTGLRCTRCNASVRGTHTGEADPRFCRDKFPDHNAVYKLVAADEWTSKAYLTDDEGNIYEYANGYRYRVTDQGLVRDKVDL